MSYFVCFIYNTILNVTFFLFTHKCVDSRVGIEHVQGESPNAYAVAASVKAAPKEEPKPAPVPEEDSSSDSD